MIKKNMNMVLENMMCVQLKCNCAEGVWIFGFWSLVLGLDVVDLNSGIWFKL